MNTHNSCLILLLTVLLVTVSCAEKSGSKYQDFVSSQKLTGINFLSDKEVLKPMRIYVCDTILITMNPMEKKLFHLFSLKSKKEIGKRISLGQGPDEMIRPSII
ncbi:TolB-like 6-bladed beta-propeller domain-containing protein, partial [Bacteroides thetaiotaomicron]|uniref:TolB-like 6-bladed beta-propeller domain-containing protein n=1 Tax=Bacteroides thetaiotaomicron TaxID=818 RepID=UPI001FB5FC43